MSHDVFERIKESGPLLADHSEAGERQGHLTDEVVKQLTDTGLVRLLQPDEFGGYEADPRDFLAAVMDVGHHCPSAGWVAGVVGVHPWELALNDRRLQEEVWGDDPDTWVASPYAPGGTATPVDGGYTVNGHWKFSSGTDHCDWVVLGAIIPGERLDAPPAGHLHVMLPRGDYEIVDDSWNVMGLEGTGSKDIVIEDAFVPEYRTIDVLQVLDGRAAVAAGREQALYRLPWSVVFPSAVSAGLVGIAEGVFQHALEYQQSRVSAVGVAQASDPHARAVLGEAASDLRSARLQLIHNAGELFEAVQSGHQVTIQERTACRRDQVRASWRAAKAADDAYAICGGNAIRLDKPLQRFWRSLHAGMHHGIVVSAPVYDTAAGVLMGEQPQGPAALTI